MALYIPVPGTIIKEQHLSCTIREETTGQTIRTQQGVSPPAPSHYQPIFHKQTMNTPTPVTIKKEPIRLSQFLKLANLVQDGVEAKIRILDGEVLVNGELETRRGRKLFAGDSIAMGDVLLKVTMNGNT
jgi:ribosome-associated protein